MRAEPTVFRISITVAANQAQSIAITTAPTKVLYYPGETFNPAGMVITATYKNGSTAPVADYTYSTVPLTSSDTAFPISYTFGGATVSANITLSFLSNDGAATANADGYYELGTPGNLTWFALRVNSGYDRTAKGKLTADFTTNSSFVPIGASTKTFGGSFDGNGHTITLNLSGSSYMGLFGYVDSAAVQKVIVDGSVAVTTTTGYAGGIAASVSGSAVIDNCINKATITAPSTNGYLGGIAGKMTGTAQVKNCYNTGSIGTSANRYVGGIVGQLGAATALNHQLLQCRNIDGSCRLLQRNNLRPCRQWTNGVSNCYWLSTCGAPYGISYSTSNQTNAGAMPKTDAELKALAGTLGAAFKSSDGYPALTWETTGSGLQGDVNGDGAVDMADLSLLLSAYGTVDAASDIDGSGTVDMTDLSLLLSAYGSTAAD